MAFILLKLNKIQLKSINILIVITSFFDRIVNKKYVYNFTIYLFNLYSEK